MIEQWGDSASLSSGVYTSSDTGLFSVSTGSAIGGGGVGAGKISKLAEIIRSLSSVELSALVRELGPDWPGPIEATGVREPRRPIRPRHSSGAVVELVLDDES